MTQINFDTFSGDPINVFNQWFEEASSSETNDPGAMALATCSADGQPSVRMVLLKGADENGFKFHTNSDSQKGQDISQNNKVALCFHWKSLRKQVRVEGIVEEVSAEEADAYFKTRPEHRRLGAWASKQSSPLENRETLDKAVEEYRDKFKGQDIPRPANWRGYRVVPHAIEFWFEGHERLHDRFIFRKDENGNWLKPQRLYP